MVSEVARRPVRELRVEALFRDSGREFGVLEGLRKTATLLTPEAPRFLFFFVSWKGWKGWFEKRDTGRNKEEPPVWVGPMPPKTTCPCEKGLPTWPKKRPSHHVGVLSWGTPSLLVFKRNQKDNQGHVFFGGERFDS